MINKLALALIRVYKRNISPIKGFNCAHRAFHGGDTCSVAVTKIIKKNGLFLGLSSIRKRFKECSHAAKNLAITQTAELSCGDAGGCLDSSPGGCFEGGGGSTDVTPTSSSSSCSILGLFVLFFSLGNPIKFAIILILSSTCLGGGYLLYGNKVAEVGIKIKDVALEDKDRKLSLVMDSELPDYQIILLVNNKKILSSVQHNSSAGDWLYMNIPVPFDLNDLQKITVVNKQLLLDKKLESVNYPIYSKESNKFEYDIDQRWSF